MRDWRVQNYSVDDDDDDNCEKKSEIELCECTMDLRERIQQANFCKAKTVLLCSAFCFNLLSFSVFSPSDSLSHTIALHAVSTGSKIIKFILHAINVC